MTVCWFAAAVPLLVFSLTEDAGRRGFSFCNQRGDYTETHTKREAIPSPAGRRLKEQFHFRSAFYLKVKKSVLFLVRQKFATVKQRVWRVDMQKNDS